MSDSPHLRSINTSGKPPDKSRSIQTINPYQPPPKSSWPEDEPTNSFAAPVSGGNIVWVTIGGTTVSGGAFGAVSMLIFTLGSWLIPTPQSTAWPAAFGTVAMGAVVGLIWALVLSLFIAPLVYFMLMACDPTRRRWTGTRIRFYGAICGFLSGFISIGLPTMLASSGLDPSAVAIALIPAIVGATGTTLALAPLARCADESLIPSDD